MGGSEDGAPAAKRLSWWSPELQASLPETICWAWPGAIRSSLRTSASGHSFTVYKVLAQFCSIISPLPLEASSSAPFHTREREDSGSVMGPGIAHNPGLLTQSFPEAGAASPASRNVSSI